MKSRSVDGEIKLVGYYPNYKTDCAATSACTPTAR